MKLLKLVPGQHQYRLPEAGGCPFYIVQPACMMAASIGLVDHQGAEPWRRFHRRPDDPGDLCPVRHGAGCGECAKRSAGWAIGEPAIQQFGKPNQVSIRMKLPAGSEANPDLSDAMTRKITAEIKAKHPDVRVDGVDSVSGKVSGELVPHRHAGPACRCRGDLRSTSGSGFEWQFGVGALFALLHDVTLTLGLFALTQMEFDLNIVAALLTTDGIFAQRHDCGL